MVLETSSMLIVVALSPEPSLDGREGTKIWGVGAGVCVEEDCGVF